MTVCTHTGLSVPECSCRACIQAQIERHMPSLLDTGEHEILIDGEGAVVTRFPRLRLRSRRRRRRRLHRAA